MPAKPKAQVDYSKYLEVASDDIPENVASLPGGHYYADITGWKTASRDYDKATGGPPTPVVELSFRIDSACDDVDPDELGGMTVKGRVATRDYRLNDPDRAGHTRVRQIAEKVVGMDVKGLAFTDILDSLKNQRVRVLNEPRPDKQEEGVFYTNITRVLPEHEPV